MTEQTANESSGPPQGAGEKLSHWLGRRRVQRLLGIAVLLLIGVIAFENTLRIPLQWDEQRLAANLVEGAATEQTARLSPLASLSVGLDARLSGMNALGYRLSSLALHLLAGVFVFLIAGLLLRGRAFGPWAALLAGALFLAHPATTQAVDYVFERGPLLAGCLALASVYVYLCARETGKPAVKPVLFVVSLGLFGLSWAAHPVAALVPPLVLLCDAAQQRHPAVRVHAPYWGLLAVFLGLHLSGVAPTGDAESGVHAVQAIRATPDALRSVFAPVNLLIAYPEPSGLLGLWLWPLMLAGAAVVGAVARRVGLGLVWFVLGLLAAGGLTASTYSDAWVYLPLAGLALALGALVALPSGRPANVFAGAIAGLLILACVAFTSTRNNVWRSEAELWIAASEACPTCYEPARRLGMLHLQQALRTLSGIEASTEAAQRLEEARGHIELALRHLDKAKEFPQASEDVDLARAQALRFLNRTEDARAALRRALAASPDDTDALLGLAEIYFQRSQESGRPEDRRWALRYYRAAEEAGELPEPSRLRYGQLLAREGDLRGSVAMLQPLTGEGSAGPAARTLREVQARLQALQVVQAALSQMAAGQAQAPVQALQAQILYFEGHVRLAESLARDGLRKNPEDVDSWTMLGLASAAQNELDTFLAAYPEGAPGAADTQGAWQRLAQTLAASGDWTATRQVLTRVYPESEVGIDLRLAEVAQRIGQAQRATGYLQQAAERDPADPAPWLRMAELALAAGQQEAARPFIEEAATRGADEETLAELRERAGAAATDSLGLERSTIIR